MKHKIFSFVFILALLFCMMTITASAAEDIEINEQNFPMPPSESSWH